MRQRRARPAFARRDIVDEHHGLPRPVAGGESPAVGTEGDGSHGGVVPGDRLPLGCAEVVIPQPDHPVTCRPTPGIARRRGGKARPVTSSGCPGKATRNDALPRLPNADDAVLIAGRQEPPVATNARLRTYLAWPCSSCLTFQPARSNTSTVLSRSIRAAATSPLSGLKATANTLPPPSWSLRVSFRVATSHTRAVPSTPALTSSLAVGAERRPEHSPLVPLERELLDPPRRSSPRL